MAMTDAFDQAYNLLNPEQREAVDTVEGPVMVVAGPGTGKTQILTLRIANIVRTTDTEPENILALTFTESGVQAMRKRLRDLIGAAAYQVGIYTFHGFTNSVIEEYPEEFPAIIGASPITEIDQVAILERILIEHDFEKLKPFGDTFFYIRAITSAIGELKREGVTVDQFEKIVTREEQSFQAIDDLYYDSGVHQGKMKGKYKDLEKQITKNKDLLKIYELYQAALREGRHYDFSDMIIEVVRALRENDDLKLRLQEQYQYFLVDEHQDTNNAQNHLVELLADYHDNPNVFVVGDEKQSIFRFQGASLENFFYFKYLYPGAKLITLRHNYRSSQAVLDVSRSLMVAGHGVEVPTLEAFRDYEIKPIDIAGYDDEETEQFAVAQAILELIKDGVESSEIAVLYRNNRDAWPIARMLERHGVQYQIESDQDLYSDPLVRRFVNTLRAVHYFGDDQHLVPLLHDGLFQVDPLDAFKVTRSGSQKRKGGIYDIIRDEKSLKDIGASRRETLLSLYANLESWSELGRREDVLTVAEAALQQSGLLQEVLSSDLVEQQLGVVNHVFDQLRQLVASGQSTLADFIEHIERMEQHGMRVRRRGGKVATDRVRLMTAHRSKGLEFEYVFIMGVYDGNWGNKRQMNMLPLLSGVYTLIEDKDRDGEIDQPWEPNDDERRLLYVAMTRAKRHIVITWAQSAPDGRERLPAQFLSDLDPDLVNEVDTSDTRQSYLQQFEQLATVPVDNVKDVANNGGPSEAMRQYVRNLFLKNPLSVSALNNYLRSPWQYLFRNLLRVPESRNRYQAYGTAVHAAINDLFEALRSGDSPDQAWLLERFELHLQQENMSEADYRDSLDKGHVALPKWFDEYSGQWVTNTLNEFRINGVLVDIGEGEQLRLTGVLDKLEFIDGDSRVNVVDYKTGRPKTRNALLGKTKEANQDYYRQLVFYKLLLSKFKDGYYQMQTGEIDFIEADDRGKFRKEKFEITDDEVVDLEQMIVRVADEIMHLKFWDTECDPDNCDYCELVAGLKDR